MTETCRFCMLAKKEAPVSLVYEDDVVMAFLDKNPLSEGHTLLMPKKHYEYIWQMPDDEAGYLFRTAKKVAIAVKEAVNADGITLSQNNGAAAGQVVFHVHVHIIPRNEGKRLFRSYDFAEEDREKLDEMAKKIRQHI